MSNLQRIGILLVAVVALVVAFVVVSDDDESDITADTVSALTQPATTPGGQAISSGSDGTTTTAAPEPEFEEVRVRGGEPVDGVQTIEVERGERARFEIRSSDTSDEVHLHGYDIEKNVRPGEPARFSFDADAEGIFEIELHGSGTQIAELEVSPG